MKKNEPSTFSPEDMKRINLASDLFSALRKNKIDFKPGSHSINKPDYLTHRALENVDTKDIPFIKKAVDSCKKLKKPFVIKGSCLNRCFICGEEPDFECDGKTISPVKSCKYPKGIKFSFELNIPSGVMVVANDLRPEFDILGNYDANTTIGCVKTSLAMAERGCAYAFVGNTCPGVYKIGQDKFVVAKPRSDEKSDKEILPKNWVSVAGICTDLWWYSIVDGNEFKLRGLKFGSGIDRVEVRPGVYKFTHFRHLLNFNDSGNKNIIFTEIRWVRPPDPVKDYKGGFMKMNLTAGQVIYHEIKRRPYLDGGEDVIQRLANQIICGSGGVGYGWHPNGFVQYDPDMPFDSPEIKIPKFSKQYAWDSIDYTHSTISQVVKGRINLNASFKKLAVNVLECIIEFGVNKKEAIALADDKARLFLEKEARKTVSSAKKFLKLIKKI